MEHCRYCENCVYCNYIGEGDYYCDMIQEIVITDFNESTDDYRGCGGKHFMEDK